MANSFNLGNGNWAQKTEKLLAYNAENDNYKPLPFDFDRASSATRVNKQGLIETVATDEPRIDFLNNTKGHLLLEPQSTNLVTYSEDFNNWIKTNTTIDSNVEVSPDGKTNASRINFSAIDSSFIRFISASGDPNGRSFTNSIYLKSDSANSVEIGILGSGGGLGYIEETLALTNEWQRFDISQTFSGSGDNLRFRLIATEVGSIFAWGGQSEEQSYATSYIPTSGSAVTRSGETCNGAGNSTVFNDSEGVLYAEIEALDDDGTSRRISLSNASTSNTVEILLQNTGRVDYQVKSGNSFQGGGFFNLTQTEYNKIAVKYKSNDLALWVNGSERSTDNSANTPIGLSELAFDNGGGGSDFYGNVKEIKVYNTALSDSELQALTS